MRERSHKSADASSWAPKIENCASSILTIKLLVRVRLVKKVREVKVVRVVRVQSKIQKFSE